MEEYLTTDELCARIKYQKQTVYNLIHRKVLVRGKHFLKPTPRKILFKWSAMQAWIGENSGLPETRPDSPSVVTLDDPAGSDGLICPRTKEVGFIRI